MLGRTSEGQVSFRAFFYASFGAIHLPVSEFAREPTAKRLTPQTQKPMKILFDPATTAAFTGYRVEKILLSSSDPRILHNIGDAIDPAVEQLYNQGYRTFLSGMAQGFDLIAAKHVITLKEKYPDIRLIAVIPHPGQSARFDELWTRYYQYCMDRADQQCFLQTYSTPRSYLDRNDFLINNSSALICYFDGQPGGTAYTVDKARRTQHILINLYQQS